jgi:hypothetical protein
MTTERGATLVPTTTYAPWLSVTRWLLRSQVAYAVGLWVTMVVATVVAVAVADAVATVEISVFQFARHGAMWSGFVLAIIIATTHLTVHVTSGLTRRDFVRATLCTGLTVALTFALLGAAGLQIERAVYEANGWGHTGVDGFDPAAGFGPALLTYVLSFASGQVGGLLVGVAYYRLGGLVGTLALPLTLAPIYLVGIGGIATGQYVPFSLGLPVLPAGLVGVAVLAVAAGAYHLLTRSVPVAQPRS